MLIKFVWNFQEMPKYYKMKNAFNAIRKASNQVLIKESISEIKIERDSNFDFSN
jgi:hypothetical protein